MYTVSQLNLALSMTQYDVNMTERTSEVYNMPDYTHINIAYTCTTIAYSDMYMHVHF